MTFTISIEEKAEVKLLYWATEIDPIITKMKGIMSFVTSLVTMWLIVGFILRNQSDTSKRSIYRIIYSRGRLKQKKRIYLK